MMERGLSARSSENVNVRNTQGSSDPSSGNPSSGSGKDRTPAASHTESAIYLGRADHAPARGQEARSESASTDGSSDYDRLYEESEKLRQLLKKATMDNKRLRQINSGLKKDNADLFNRSVESVQRISIEKKQLEKRESEFKRGAEKKVTQLQVERNQLQAELQVTKRNFVETKRSFEKQIRTLAIDLREQQRRSKNMEDANHSLNCKVGDLRAQLEVYSPRGGNRIQHLALEVEELREKITRYQDPVLKNMAAEKSTRIARKACFPWLRVPPEEKIEEAILNLPDLTGALWRRICIYLDEDTRFDMRVLNSTFYRAFFATSTYFGSRPTVMNYFRALKLAEKGRVFHNVRHLEFCLPDEATLSIEQDHTSPFKEDPAQSLHGRPRFNWRRSRDGFPMLESIGTNSLNLRITQLFERFGPEPGINVMRCNRFDSERATTKLLPNLRTLVLTDTDWGHRGALFTPHDNLTEIVYTQSPQTRCLALWPSHLRNVSRLNFPNLQILRYEDASSLGDGIKNSISVFRAVGNNAGIAKAGLHAAINRLKEEGIIVSIVDDDNEHQELRRARSFDVPGKRKEPSGVPMRRGSADPAPTRKIQRLVRRKNPGVKQRAAQGPQRKAPQQKGRFVRTVRRVTNKKKRSRNKRKNHT